MRTIVQRVKQASVSVNSQVIGKIDHGLLVFFAVHKNDSINTTSWMAKKLAHLRIFPDEKGKMNKSVLDIHGAVLVVSQFTLYANCESGRRPDFIDSAPPDFAEQVYERFTLDIKELLGSVQTGKFAADMQVELINDGPVTMIVDKF